MQIGQSLMRSLSRLAPISSTLLNLEYRCVGSRKTLTSSRSDTCKTSLARAKVVSSFGEQARTCDASDRSHPHHSRSSEKASKTYTTEVVTNILAEEGKEMFDSRYVALGHTLQGGVPSPRDRTRAIRLSVKCIDFLEKHNKRRLAGESMDATDPDVSTIVIEGAGIRFASMKEMHEAADYKHRRGKYQWWASTKTLVDLMAGRVNMEELDRSRSLPVAAEANGLPVA